MLHDEESAGVNEFGIEDKRRDFLEARVVIRGISEDDVVSFLRAGDEFEDITPYDTEIFIAKFFFNGADEIDLSRGHFDGSDLLCFTRQEFEGHGTGTGEEVEHRFIFDILDIFDDIEDIFASEIRCRTGSYVFRWVESTPAVFSSDDSHYMIDRPLRGRCYFIFLTDFEEKGEGEVVGIRGEREGIDFTGEAAQDVGQSDSHLLQA